MTERRKKLIEVSIPLEAINKASVREKSIRQGHPSTLHLWWARRPLAACRAVLFAQLVDDPSAWPERFPTEEEQRIERERLHKIIEAMVPWKASNNEDILNKARYEIARSVAWGLGEEPPTKNNPKSVLAYLQKKAPPVYDPFSGGGSIPLEAQRLGLRAYGSDLNPVAVLVSKALVEIPPKFAGRPPVNPDYDKNRTWKGAEGLADDIRYYGKWMRDEAEKKIGKFYPKVKLQDGTEATVVAWLWARTVASPDPAAKGAHVPLASTFMLSTKKKESSWVEVVSDSNAQDGWRFKVNTGNLPNNKKEIEEGTKTGRGAHFKCVIGGAPINADYIKAEGVANKMSARLMAIVAKGPKGRLYISPNNFHGEAARIDTSEISALEQELPNDPRNFWTKPYGLNTYQKLFTARQLMALTTFSDLIGNARARTLKDARAVLTNDSTPLSEGGAGLQAYVDAISTYLAFVVSRLANRGTTITMWNTARYTIEQTFAKQAIPMKWDFAEANPFSDSTGNWFGGATSVEKVLQKSILLVGDGCIAQHNAAFSEGFSEEFISHAPLIATDPPYYDNINYADLSDFFYLCLRRSIRSIWPDLFKRVLTPKDTELIAAPYRHGGKKDAEKFFMEGMSKALAVMHDSCSDWGPVTLYYAFKQSEKTKEGLISPGWASFLQAVTNAGFVIDGTWPLRTERDRGLKSSQNVLASSIVLVCTKRPPNAQIITRRDFTARLKNEMPGAIQKIKDAGVGPVDIAQSALGPGMGIFTGCTKVLEPDDSEMTVRAAIALINQVREEIMGEEDAGYDTATRFCIDWFQAFGMEPGESGNAITMAQAYNLSINELESAGVLHAKGGVTRLLQRDEMPEDWTPGTDKTLTHWECAQHLIRVLEAEGGGGDAAAKMIAEMKPEDAASARALAYRLYDICEKKGWAQEAQGYNLLAGELPHLELKALEFQNSVGPAQHGLDLEGGKS